MRRAVLIELVADHFEKQLSQAEALYERAFPPGLYDPNEVEQFSPASRERIRQRYKWLLYGVRHALGWAEEAGVGAIWNPNLDDQFNDHLLEQVCLLREQLYWQEEIDTVPRVLTEYAVKPFYEAGEITADYAVWCRQQLRRTDRRDDE